MSDIKQAAEWMKEGKSVKRRRREAVYYPDKSGLSVIQWGGQDAYFLVDDLLADDWEIAE